MIGKMGSSIIWRASGSYWPLRSGKNILLDCSKNEVFVLLDLLRQGEVTMSELAGYLQVPLNTVTGIITRMEKKQLVEQQAQSQ